MSGINLTLDLLVAYFRMCHPKSARNNNHIARACWVEARTFNPNARKLGKMPSIFQGYNGLPQSSEHLIVDEATFNHLMDFVRKGARRISVAAPEAL